MLPDDDVHLRALHAFYGARTAKRSGVPLVNHVVEGLRILDAIDANVHAQRAFCLHPIVQGDAELAGASAFFVSFSVDVTALMIAMEYRRCANAHLSTHAAETLQGLSLAPFLEVKHMLIADKVQNRRDFERHHAKTHARAAELSAYFSRWLRFLDVDEAEYQRLLNVIGGP